VLAPTHANRLADPPYDVLGTACAPREWLGPAQRLQAVAGAERWGWHWFALEERRGAGSELVAVARRRTRPGPVR